MRILTFFFILMINAFAISQQIALTSQYIINELSINPAVVGLKGHTQIGLSFRRQWAGIDEAPVTQTLWGHAPLRGGFGIGGILYNDVSGPTRRTGFNPVFGYQMRLNRKYMLSIGGGASLTQYFLDRSQMQTELPNDIAVDENSNNQFVPDANIGFWLTSKNMFAGISAWHLVQSKKDLFHIEAIVKNTLDRTYFFTSGYSFTLSRKAEFTPSFVIRMMRNAPLSFDLNSTFTYQKKYWGGISYRYKDAVSILIGIRSGPVRIGYSYDAGISKFNRFHNGSHELFLGIDAGDLYAKKIPWKRRNKVFSSFSNM